MTANQDLIAKVEEAVRVALAEQSAVPIGAAQAAGARGILSAAGRNRPGVVARMSGVLSELNVDIRDISQTVVGDFFTMIIVFDLSSLEAAGVPFKTLKERLERAAGGMGFHAVVLHEDILDAMHRV